MQEQAAEKRTLYVVATPIGNISDISSRALGILRSADFILCEDTRHSGLLLDRYGIKSKLVSYFAHNEALRVDQIVPLLDAGASAAVISDAGSPGISDPGARIVDACHEAGIRVSPIPGASAVVAAISAAGFYECPQFEFVAFFPRKNQEKRSLFESTLKLPRVLVGYESPQRIVETLRDLAAVAGSQKRVCLCRELTKKFETVMRATVGEIIEYYTANTPKGEICLVIEGVKNAENSKPDDALSPEAEKLAALLIGAGLGARTIRDIVAQYCGARPKSVYRYVLENAPNGDKTPPESQP